MTIFMDISECINNWYASFVDIFEILFNSRTSLILFYAILGFKCKLALCYEIKLAANLA